MAIIAYNDDPSALLNAIKKAVDNDKIETWSYDEDGDFTHTAPQWNSRAWLRPRILLDRLVFNIVPPQTKTISREVYGIYHGRFIEMLLTHFDGKFTKVYATAMPTRNDRVKPSVTED
jgi:hypothetical protein